MVYVYSHYCEQLRCNWAYSSAKMPLLLLRVKYDGVSEASNECVSKDSFDFV